jgi:hypothetical protein
MMGNLPGLRRRMAEHFSRSAGARENASRAVGPHRKALRLLNSCRIGPSDIDFIAGTTPVLLAWISIID